MAQITLNSSGVASNGTLALQSNGTTTAVTIDTSQNVGVGVTPSAWDATGKAIENPAGALYGYSTSQQLLTQNTFFDGAWKYKTTAQASYYQQSSGTHIWHTAASGTAGNAITFAERMRIDSSGNVGIGTSSPSVNLEIGANTSTVRALSVRYSSVPVYLSNSYDGTLGLSTLSANNYNTSNGSSSWSSFSNTGFGSSAVQLAVSTSGADIRFLTAAAANTNPSERARIDSSGNLLVGSTSAVAGEKLNVTGSVGTFVSRITNTNASPQGTTLYYATVTPNNSVNEFLYCYDATTLRMSVRSNGGIANFSANNVNLSDRREKINFAPAGEYLSKICAIPVQTFNYIDQNMEEDGGLTLGVVAQDVQAVAPEMVMESNWGTEEEPKMRLSIYQTDLQYALMKSIQELKALVDGQAVLIATQASTITSLTDRITALEQA